MVEFVVIERTGQGSMDWRQLPDQQFAVAPRKGDFIAMNDDKGIGQAYEVIAVVHPVPPAAEAGDLIVRHIGTSTAWRQSL